jgi:hypothetical protein
MKNPSWITEFKGLYETLKNEWWIIFLFPFFFSSNIFYTYQGSMYPCSDIAQQNSAPNPLQTALTALTSTPGLVP